MKPDQLLKRRGKLGLVAVDRDWPQVRQWIEQKMNSEIQVRSSFEVWKPLYTVLYWHAAVDIISCSVLTGQINFILLSASPLFRDSIYSLKAIPCPAPAGTWDHFCVREKLFPQQLIFARWFFFFSSSLLFICANCAREICLTLDTAVEQFITWFLSEFEFEFSCL